MSGPPVRLEGFTCNIAVTSDLEGLNTTVGDLPGTCLHMLKAGGVEIRSTSPDLSCPETATSPSPFY